MIFQVMVFNSQPALFDLLCGVLTGDVTAVPKYNILVCNEFNFLFCFGQPFGEIDLIFKGGLKITSGYARFVGRF
jgi:hypothetical protein